MDPKRDLERAERAHGDAAIELADALLDRIGTALPETQYQRVRIEVIDYREARRRRGEAERAVAEAQRIAPTVTPDEHPLVLIPASESGVVASCRVDGLEVSVCRGSDGILVVQIDGPDGEADQTDDDAPKIRVHLNDATLYDGECVRCAIGPALGSCPHGFDADLAQDDAEACGLGADLGDDSAPPDIDCDAPPTLSEDEARVLARGAHVPPERQGQTVEVGFVWEEGQLYRVTRDRSLGPSAAPVVELADEVEAAALPEFWHPTNGDPPGVSTWTRVFP